MKDAWARGNLRAAGRKCRWNEGFTPTRSGADTSSMTKVRLLSLLVFAALLALMLAGAHMHHPTGMNDGGYW